MNAVQTQQKLRREAAKAAGKCPNHPQRLVAPGKGRCRFCLTKAKAIYKTARQAGVCPSHPDRLVVPGKTSCTVCVRRYKQRYANAKHSGKCPGHPDRNAAPGKTICAECIEYNQQHRIEARAASKCPHHSGQKVFPGHPCAKCTEGNQKRAEQAKKKGWCPNHIGRKPLPGKTKCAECRNKSRKAGLLRNYGIDEDLYNDLLARQNGVCALCKQPERTGKGKLLSVDHDHKQEQTTGRVLIRGLLCHYCNTGLGLFEKLYDIYGQTYFTIIADYLKHPTQSLGENS